MKEENNTVTPILKPLWSAVLAVALAVAGLITSEFLPVSMLTPMARDLRITEGVAGQAISITAIMGMVASLLVPSFTKQINRRWVLLAFGLLQILSNLVVAYSPNFALLLTGRVLLGIGLGGFWSMAAATATRLVPKELIPKALSIIFGAVSVATVVAAPMGSYLGEHIGWRNVFLIAAALGVIAFIAQAVSLPSMPTGKAAKLGDLLKVLKRPYIKAGMWATMFVFIGYATFFTYLRPFLEVVSGVNANTLSTILLGFGIANLMGTSLARYLLEWNIFRSLTIAPLLMGIIVTGLVFAGQITMLASILVAAWGMVFGVVQVGWTDWLTRTIPDELESGGGIQIAVIQLGITAGAAVGGFIFDLAGTKGVFLSSSIFTLFAALIAMMAFRKQARRSLQRSPENMSVVL
ncbi:MFS transporter [Mucilaginibacter lappiensis]|uniref:Putative MFS family arabinose efflux permease n=1 Tax=Mucilaginibacter lappiensis TaxID=354630 RepID=A0A841JIR3_9SPHI|nr:MFS transporter [Mucilaginibacter lappiensis]MBB6130830.1 putative MFS family arabinose efflux permease [Mucilaginibacter lappiensis]